MGFLIDSNILIAAERGKFSWVNLGQSLPTDTLGIAAITASELLCAIYRAQDPAVGTRRQRFVESILENFPVFPFDLPVARVHAQLWADLSKRGMMIGAHDLLIAATASTLGYGVVTANVREFSRIPNLSILNPL
jgi:tRNA(fMet)-specific endonuclease VapC